jgi:hypothetical protein
MQYLVQMKIVPQGRPMSAEEGAVFFEEFIHPTLELCVLPYCLRNTYLSLLLVSFPVRSFVA